jgi:branched-chain amino acid:cation transporter, LIVCS family
MTANVEQRESATIVFSRRAVFSTGLAIFAMFFGAGNIVFPLALGSFTQDKTVWGILGLIITAVFVPLAGLLAMLLYDGDYTSFFRRIGKLPGFFVTAAILALIGPFGGIPRCITISFSTLNAFCVESSHKMHLLTFSSFTCLLLFLFTYRPRRILSLLGYILTPLLLCALGLIVVKGLFSMPEADSSLLTRCSVFSKGLLEGYNTLDLLAAFFFSSIVLFCLQKNVGEEAIKERKNVLNVAMLGSLIAALLLSLVYICFSFLAAGYSNELKSVESDQLLGTLAYQLLGPWAGLIASIAICFACFTTEIALTAIFAGFLQKSLFKEKINFSTALIMTLMAACLMSTLQFSGISAFLVPIVQVCYPALIVLSILNIMYKLFGFKPVKCFFYGTIAISLLAYLFG